jgi:hypothetical protein
METIKINYKGETFEVRLNRIKAYPYDIFKIEFDDSPQLETIMESPVYMVEMPNKLSFPELQNTDQIDLLMSFAEGIEANYPI